MIKTKQLIKSAIGLFAMAFCLFMAQSYFPLLELRYGDILVLSTVFFVYLLNSYDIDNLQASIDNLEKRLNE